MGAYSHTDVKLLDPSSGMFLDVDYGNASNGLVLLNILIELRVITAYLAEMNNGIVADDPNQMRTDQVRNPVSMTQFTTTSNS